MFSILSIVTHKPLNSLIIIVVYGFILISHSPLKLLLLNIGEILISGGTIDNISVIIKIFIQILLVNYFYLS